LASIALLLAAAADTVHAMIQNSVFATLAGADSTAHSSFNVQIHFAQAMVLARTVRVNAPPVSRDKIVACRMAIAFHHVDLADNVILS
jgi:hypothetical protein